MKIPEDLHVYTVSNREAVIFQAIRDADDTWQMINSSYIAVCGSSVVIKIVTTAAAPVAEFINLNKFSRQFTRPLVDHAK